MGGGGLPSSHYSASRSGSGWCSEQPTKDRRCLQPHYELQDQLNEIRHYENELRNRVIAFQEADGLFGFLYINYNIIRSFPAILLKPTIAFGNPGRTVTVSHAVIKGAYVGSTVERTEHFCIPPYITVINLHASSNAKFSSPDFPRTLNPVHSDFTLVHPHRRV